MDDATRLEWPHRMNASDAMFWFLDTVPIALYSYRDVIHVGLDVDPLAMPDVEHFRDALAEAYAEALNIGARTVALARQSA